MHYHFTTPTSPPTVPFTEQATRASVHDDFAGLLNGALPNPDPVLTKLGAGIDVLRELLVDSHLSGAIASRKAGVLEQQWSIGRGGVDSDELRFTRRVFASLDINQLIADLLDAPLFGYQPIEIIYQRRSDNRIVPRESGQDRPGLVAKPQEWFDFDLKNRFRIRRGFDRPKLPNRFKFLLPRHRATYQNPYGQALLSSCYWPVVIKRQGSKMFTVFVEKFGMPWPVVKYRPGMKRDEIIELVNLLDELVSDGILAIPTDGDLSLMQGTANGGREVYKVLAELMNDEISKAILSHTGSIQSSGGRLGNENIAGDVRDSLIREGKRMVEKEVNRLVDYLWLINFNRRPPEPLFSLYDEEEVNQTKATRDWLLREMGVRFTKEYYAREYDLNPEDFEVGMTVEEIRASSEAGDVSALPSDPTAEKTVSPPDPSRGIRESLRRRSEGVPTNPRASLRAKLAAVRRAVGKER